jgi:hypothetical protein
MNGRYMREIKITLSDAEEKAVLQAMPMLEKFHHLIPAGLLSVVKKVKGEINGK